jgi:hypothetical protein
MSTDPDRIAVPTNGRRPHAVATVPAEEKPPPEASPTVPAASNLPSDADLATALSPRQLAVGFGILASIMVLVAGRVLRRRSRG